MTHASSSIFKKLLSFAGPVTAGARAWRVILVLLVACIAVLALMPTPPPDASTGWDKLNHLLAFGSLAFAATMGSSASRTRQAWMLLALLGFGALIELLQLHVPGRSAEWADLLADAIGIVCGAVAARCLQGAATAVTVVEAGKN